MKKNYRGERKPASTGLCSLTSTKYSSATQCNCNPAIDARYFDANPTREFCIRPLCPHCHNNSDVLMRDERGNLGKPNFLISHRLCKGWLMQSRIMPSSRQLTQIGHWN